MRSKVTLVARNLGRAEKIPIQDEIKDAIGSVAVAEIGALYKADATLAEMAQHAYEIASRLLQKGPARLFFAGVVSFIAGMILQFLGAWPDAALPSALSPSRSGR